MRFIRKSMEFSGNFIEELITLFERNQICLAISYRLKKTCVLIAQSRILG